MTHSPTTLVWATIASATLHFGVSWGLREPAEQTRHRLAIRSTAHQSHSALTMMVRQLPSHSIQGLAKVSTSAAASSPAPPTPAPLTNSAQTGETTTSPGDVGEPAYWPRRLLDLGPTPTTTVILPTPEDVAAPSSGVAILELFIDEEGRVDRIDVLESNAPAAFVDAAKASFLITPFTPGLKDNVAVPSRVKIEVRYE